MSNTRRYRTLSDFITITDITNTDTLFINLFNQYLINAQLYIHW